MTDKKATEPTEPRESTLHNISSLVAPQFSSVLERGFRSIFPVRGNQFDASFFQPISQLVAVGGFVIDQPSGFLSRSPAFSRNRHFAQRLFNERHLVGRGRFEENSQRKTLTVDHHHPLCAFPPLGFADGSAPFFAGAKLPSAKLSLHFINPFSSSSPRNARHTLSHTPCSSQSRRRRQQVLGLGYSGGRSRHRAPVFNTHRIPSSTSRLSLGGRPPFLFSLRFFFGSRGAIFSHCSSVNNFPFRAIGEITSGSYILHKSPQKSSVLHKNTCSRRRRF